MKTLIDLRQELGGDRFLSSAKPQPADRFARFAGCQRGEMINHETLQSNVTRNRIEAGAVTARTFPGFGLVDALGFALRRQFVFQNRIAVVLSPSLKGAIP